MRKKERYEKVIEWFQQNRPIAETELQYSNPFELLIAVILSAQCTDKRVNQITPALFRDFPTPEALAATTPEVVFEYIRSVSYPNNKAKHLVGMAQMLVEQFHSEVPDTLEALTRLPGVGRKTANVIQSVVFNKAAMAVDTHVFRVSHRLGLVTARCTTPLSLPGVGRKTANVIQSVVFNKAAMAVDTHVFRVSHRLGLVTARCTTPLSVEKELTKHIPEELIPIAHHWLILHGRYICVARNPQCTTCGLQMICKYFYNTYKVIKEDTKDKNK